MTPIIAIYIYFNKSDKVSKIFYPNLYRVMNEFIEAIEEEKEGNPYFEAFKVYGFRRNKKNSNEYYVEAAYYINKLLDEENISMNLLAKYSNVKYPNLYNFLRREKYGTIKIQKVHKVLWILWGMKNNWTIEEVIAKHEEKLKNLWLHWRVDIDGLERDD